MDMPKLAHQTLDGAVSTAGRRAGKLCTLAASCVTTRDPKLAR